MKLALRYHPDRSSSPKAKEKFQKVGQGYQILINSQNQNQFHIPDNSDNPIKKANSDLELLIRESDNEIEEGKKFVKIKKFVNIKNFVQIEREEKVKEEKEEKEREEKKK